MSSRELHDGRRDGLTPLESFSLDDVDTFADLLRVMSRTAFGGRQLGEAFDVCLEMMQRDECHVVLSVSGAMTVAKQGKLICDMIDRRLVDAVISTGALIAHGLTESMGLTHYRYDPSKSDDELFAQGYNRIYDTLEMEANLNDVERLVRWVLEHRTPQDGVWSSRRLCSALGKRLSETAEGAGVLRSAYEQNVQVFIPAFTDSEIGLDVATWALRNGADQCERDGFDRAEAMRRTPPPAFNPFQDLMDYASLVGEADELGILTIGGGVPRNWAQQVAPFYDIVNHRVGTKLRVPRFKYGVRICPEPVHWGGLSGCTYSEGVSWGKFVPRQEGGRFAEVYADATVVWPLLMKAIFEEVASN